MRGAGKHVNKYIGFSNVSTTSGYGTPRRRGSPAEPHDNRTVQFAWIFKSFRAPLAAALVKG